MARKKIVFVIVEGSSDDEALGVFFNRLFDKNAVYVEITHGDITSDFSVKPENIASRIGNLVKNYAKANHYKVTDFQNVIHLIDMDGAYIPESAVKQDETAEKARYTTEHIFTEKPEQLILRNKRKRENVDKISNLHKVWGSIPYRAYYMSANLDHVLYDKLNSTDEDKEKDAFLFAKYYKDHLQEFLIFIACSEFSVQGDFKETWEYIKKEKHSLERHTNLGLCFENMEHIIFIEKVLDEQQKKENR